MKKNIILALLTMVLLAGCYSVKSVENEVVVETKSPVTEITEEKKESETVYDINSEDDVIYLAGGCFWGFQKYLLSIPGVEKAVAGYIEYLGKYMYFDKDGIIVESSDQKTAGIPQITGLEFNYVVLHERLPIENTEIFQSILDITQLLEKYEISAEKIYFDKNQQMTLYFENIRVRLGDISNIDDKITRVKTILPDK